MWLNEGFASYVEYLGADHVAPSSGIMDRFPIREIQSTFLYDSLQSSHPISIKVEHPDEIGQIFDSISYGKGASIIRMMANFLGINNFNQGISNYLKQHKYGNAQQDDLWQSLTDIAAKQKILNTDISVKNIMDTWTLQMGYPVLNVARDYATNEIRFSQERFLMFRDLTVKDDHAYKWWIPISYTYSDGDFINTDTNFWLPPAIDNILSIPNSVLSKPIAQNSIMSQRALIVNIQQTGYYRVNYDEENWNLIHASIERNISSIHRINRAQIIDDSMNLARAGYLKYEIALKLIDQLEYETDYIPWKAGLRNFRFIRKMLARTASYGFYKQYMRQKINPMYTSLYTTKEKKNDDVMDELLKAELMKEICEIDLAACKKFIMDTLKISSVTEEKNMVGSFKEIIENKHDLIPGKLKGVTYCTLVKEGNEKEWNYVWKKYTKSSNANFKRHILNALGCSRHIWVLKVCAVSIVNVYRVKYLIYLRNI